MPVLPWEPVIAPPRVAAVLNVGTAHIGEFGSREAIAQAKGEIVEALPADGTAVLNADDDLVAVGPAAVAMAEGFEARPATSGRSAVAITTAGHAAAVDWLRHNVSAADVVLVKASRGAALEVIADELLVIEVEGSSTR